MISVVNILQRWSFFQRFPRVTAKTHGEKEYILKRRENRNKLMGIIPCYCFPATPREKKYDQAILKVLRKNGKGIDKTDACWLKNLKKCRFESCNGSKRTIGDVPIPESIEYVMKKEIHLLTPEETYLIFAFYDAMLRDYLLEDVQSMIRSSPQLYTLFPPSERVINAHFKQFAVFSQEVQRLSGRRIFPLHLLFPQGFRRFKEAKENGTYGSIIQKNERHSSETDEGGWEELEVVDETEKEEEEEEEEEGEEGKQEESKTEKTNETKEKLTLFVKFVKFRSRGWADSMTRSVTNYIHSLIDYVYPIYHFGPTHSYVGLRKEGNVVLELHYLRDGNVFFGMPPSDDLEEIEICDINIPDAKSKKEFMNRIAKFCGEVGIWSKYAQLASVQKSTDHRGNFNCSTFVPYAFKEVMKYAKESGAGIKFKKCDVGDVKEMFKRIKKDMTWRIDARHRMKKASLKN